MSTALHVELSEEMSVSHTGPADVDFIYVDPAGFERREPPYDELDPGIRETVRWLFEHGFNPCDSGDGVSKIGTLPGALDQPHVFMLVSKLERIEVEVDRLNMLLEAKGIHLHGLGPLTEEEAEELGVGFIPPQKGSVKGYLQGSYTPGGPATIELFGVNDAILIGS